MKLKRSEVKEFEIISIRYNVFQFSGTKLGNGLNRIQSTQNINASFCMHETNFRLSEIYPDISPIPLPTPLEKPRVPQG